MSGEALVTRDERGNISVLTMVYRPYNLLGPKFLSAIVQQVEPAQKAGSRAIVIRSGLRHFSAGAVLVGMPALGLAALAHEVQSGRTARHQAK